MSIDSSDGKISSPEPGAEVEEMSQDLKDQVRMARERLSDRYSKLMEERAFGQGAKARES